MPNCRKYTAFSQPPFKQTPQVYFVQTAPHQPSTYTTDPENKV